MSVLKSCVFMWRSGEVLGLVRRRFSVFTDPISAIAQKKVHFNDEKIIGYPVEKVYDIVADVERYKEFLPWCQESYFVRQGASKSIAKLSIGFPPLIESYTALLQTNPPHSLRNISTDGRLFSHLENSWEFREGPHMSEGPTCHILFWVRFEFHSAVTARLGSIFFDEVARTMTGAFEKRCTELYGPSHLKNSDFRTEGVPDTPNHQT